jgi:hypothetical protein
VVQKESAADPANHGKGDSADERGTGDNSGELLDAQVEWVAPIGVPRGTAQSPERCPRDKAAGLTLRLSGHPSWVTVPVSEIRAQAC